MPGNSLPTACTPTLRKKASYCDSYKSSEGGSTRRGRAGQLKLLLLTAFLGERSLSLCKEGQDPMGNSRAWPSTASALGEDTGQGCEASDTYTDELWRRQHGHCAKTQLPLRQQLLWQGLLVQQEALLLSHGW